MMISKETVEENIRNCLQVVREGLGAQNKKSRRFIATGVRGLHIHLQTIHTEGIHISRSLQVRATNIRNLYLPQSIAYHHEIERQHKKLHFDW